MTKNYFISMQKGFLALMSAALLFSCSQNESETPTLEVDQTEKFKVVLKGTDGNEFARTVFSFCGEAKTVDLIAGQNTVVGEVSAYNNKESLFITISTNGAWFIRKTHLYTGERDKTEGIKNPAPGKFPYSYDATSLNNYGVQEYTYEIDASALENWGEFDIAVHADVVRVAVDGNGAVILDSDGNADILQKEGAWGNGTRFTLKGNWATFFTYMLRDCAVSCTDDWARSVSRSNNGEGESDFQSDKFELVDGNNVIGTATYQRERTGGTGQNPIYKITVKYSLINSTDYSFNEFGAFYSSTALSGVTRDSFSDAQIKTTADGGEFIFDGITGDTYYLGLYAKITGLCR